MAIINPRGLYQSGAYLDVKPFYNAYNKLIAEKQAKQEALDKYFTDLQGKINTAGVRVDRDLPGISKDIENWASQWPTVSKGGVMERQKFLQGYQNILSKIEQSKNRAKTEMELGKMRQEGKYDPTDDDMHVLENISKSIYDPSSYKTNGMEYGWADLSPSIPDFDRNKFMENLKKGRTPGEKFDFDTMKTDPVTGKAVVSYTKSYDPKQVKEAADEVGMVGLDKSANKYYEKFLDNPKSEAWIKRNEAYQSVYGKDKIVATPIQAAQADAILEMSGTKEMGQRLITDTELQQQRAMQKAIMQSNLIASRKDSDSKGQPLNLSNYPKEGDSSNVTELMQGINVGKNWEGKLTSASKVLYNPKLKLFTVTDEDGNVRKVDFDTFRQNIATINTGIDLKQIDRLGATTDITPVKTSSKTSGGTSNWKSRAKTVK